MLKYKQGKAELCGPQGVPVPPRPRQGGCETAGFWVEGTLPRTDKARKLLLGLLPTPGSPEPYSDLAGRRRGGVLLLA